MLKIFNKKDNTKKKKIFSKGCKLQTFIGRALYANVFELFVYDTRANMKAGIQKWITTRNYKTIPKEETSIAGMVLEEEDGATYVDSDGFEYKVFAAMFLNEADFSMETCAHECLHVTMVYERNVLRFMGMYEGNDDTGEAAEERLAYTIGEYIDLILKQCIKHKIKIRYIDEEVTKK
jgi:hypothetical protein